MRWVGRAGYEEVVSRVWGSGHCERIEGGCRAAICDKLWLNFAIWSLEMESCLRKL